MKRILVIGMLPLLLLGCKPRDDMLERLLSFRESITQSKATFETEITADYGEEYYVFSMSCSVEETGDLAFSVLEPESIQDIRGTIDDQGGNLSFDDQILAFDTMAEGRITPVSAPFILMRALRGGYISSVSQTAEGFCAMIDDSYADNALNLQIFFCNNLPVYGEIFWNQRRIITLKIEDFQVLQQTVNHCIG